MSKMYVFELPKREKHVMDLLATGLKQIQVAAQLGMSVSAVSKMVWHAKRKQAARVPQ